MADMLKGLFGGAKSAVTSAASEVDDFADFATAASPSAPSHAASSAFASATAASSQQIAGVAGGFFSPVQGMQGRPYTKWYRVWERVTIRDFYVELFILPIILVVALMNVYGSHVNRKKARGWMASHLGVLDAEFAQVGFAKRVPSAREVEDKGLAKAMAGTLDVDEGMLRQKGKNEYFTYATGRQNVAHLDLKLTLYKRYNPFLWAGEAALSFFFDSVPAPVERVEATAYVFDGKEKMFAPNAASSGGGGKDSSYDGFVFAIVHKDKMRQLREERYDISLTTTRDHQKLPEWATTMSESAEITEALLTPELLKAVEECGEDLEALIVSDQPIDAPKKLNDTLPLKRLSLSMKLSPSSSSSLTLLQAFLRLPDTLVSSAHFRPEALRKVRATRDEEARKIRKLDEDEKAEERRNLSDRQKKEERERKLAGMKPEEQKKFLERERQRERDKGMKRRTQRA